MYTRPENRIRDNHGEGHYGASRGSRTHKGVDLRVKPGAKCFSHVSSVVTKLGYPYSDDYSFRYVEVTDEESRKHRFFYINPMVEVGDPLNKGDLLGTCQKLGDRYRGITEHVHYEVKLNGEFLDPNLFL